jgi:hypothetical protein
MIGLKLIADLIELSGLVKVKQLKVEQRSSKVVIEAEFEDEEQAKLVLELFSKYKSELGW